MKSFGLAALLTPNLGQTETFGGPRAQNLLIYESKEGLEELVQWNFGVDPGGGI